MMCLAVAVDLWGLVIAVVAIGGCNFCVIALFVWYLHSRDRLFTQTVKGIEHSCHDFQRQLNDNTREAFKSILVTLHDAKKSLDTNSEIMVKAIEALSRYQAAERPVDKGQNI
jgi:hypothetical protein